MKIGLITDIHMRSEKRDSIRRELRQVVNYFDDSFDPDHVFIIGDLIQDEETKSDDKRNLMEVHDVFEAASFSKTYLLGNHDVENLTQADISAILDVDRFWGVVTVEGHDFVYLDSSAPHLPGARGELGKEQLNYLRNTLPGLEDAILLVHHPVGYVDLRDNYWFDVFPELAFLGDRKELLKIAEQTGNVRATFCGHIHQTRFTRFWDIDHVAVNAFSKELPDVPLTGTYAEMVVNDDIVVDIYDSEQSLESFTIE